MAWYTGDSEVGSTCDCNSWVEVEVHGAATFKGLWYGGSREEKKLKITSSQERLVL